MKESKVIPRGTMIDMIINIPLFDKLKSNELSIVAKHINYIDLKEGEILFKEGVKGDFVCFVIDGTLDVIKKTETGENVVISSLPKGRSIGEMSIIDGYPRSATVKARTEAKLVTLTRDGFEIIQQEYPRIGIKIFKSLSRLLSLNLRKTSSSLADHMFPIS
jgi:CRP-like cAMP-binding protein